MDTSEKNFEAAVEASLLRDPLAGGAGGIVISETATGASAGGYRKRDPREYDKSLCLIPGEVVAFIQATQPKEWQKMQQSHGAEAKNILLKRLCSEITVRGTL